MHARCLCHGILHQQSSMSPNNTSPNDTLLQSTAWTGMIMPAPHDSSAMHLQGATAAAPDLKLLVRVYRARLHALTGSAQAARSELRAIRREVGA